MNMFKKNGGFTLVELIVVIAILAILAGIAVPAYSGYINSANEAADITSLAAVKTAAQATMATKGSVSKIEVTATSGEITSVKVTVGTEVTELYGVKTAENDPTPASETSSTETTTAPAAKYEFLNTDFATYMNNEMPDLSSKTFASGAVWAGSDWEAPAEDATAGTTAPTTAPTTGS